MVNEVKPDPEKDAAPILVSVFGRVTEESLLQSVKAPPPILVMELDISTLDRLLQPEKTLYPKVNTE